MFEKMSYYKAVKESYKKNIKTFTELERRASFQVWAAQSAISGIVQGICKPVEQKLQRYKSF